MVKFVLALCVLFPPAFFMGGTFPVMGQHFVRKMGFLGRSASALYAFNTLGAALGVCAAGFYLLRQFGFMDAYLLTIATTCGIAFFAWLFSVRASRVSPVVLNKNQEHEQQSCTALSHHVSARTIRILAFLSGFGTVGLEVLWTRMFEQVMQNSVYSFSTILASFLLCLSIGAAGASLPARIRS